MPVCVFGIRTVFVRSTTIMLIGHFRRLIKGTFKPYRSLGGFHIWIAKLEGLHWETSVTITRREIFSKSY